MSITLTEESVLCCVLQSWIFHLLCGGFFPCLRTKVEVHFPIKFHPDGKRNSQDSSPKGKEGNEALIKVKWSFLGGRMQAALELLSRR